MSIGIYKLEIGPWFYWGQSIEMEKRWDRHQKDLARGIHTCRPMQAVYDVIQTVTKTEHITVSDPSTLDSIEHALITADYLNPYCMNWQRDIIEKSDVTVTTGPRTKYRYEVTESTGLVTVWSQKSKMCEHYRQSSNSIHRTPGLDVRRYNLETGMLAPIELTPLSTELELKLSQVLLQLKIERGI